MGCGRQWSKARSSGEERIKGHLQAGKGILKTAKEVGVGGGTVQRIKREARFSPRLAHTGFADQRVAAVLQQVEVRLP